jgi:hypothetical protein
MAKALWDVPFIRALNKAKDPDKPTNRRPHKGCVLGARLYVKHGDYFSMEPAKTQKERVRLENLDLKNELAMLKENMPRQVQAQVSQQVSTQVAKEVEALMPALYSNFATWVQGGCVGPAPPFISMASSNSAMTPAPSNMVTLAATIPYGRGVDDLSIVSEQVSTPSVSCTPVRAGPSTLAELDAITVFTSLSIASIVKLITSCILALSDALRVSAGRHRCLHIAFVHP